MISRSIVTCITVSRPSILQCSLMHRILVQNSRCTIRCHRFSSSGSAQDSVRPSILNHKDWLSTNEVVKIFQSLKDPNAALPVLNEISKRKDYKPNEALYTAVIINLALSKNFDGIDDVMERVKTERSCRLSENFFYNVIKIYGNVGGRINRAIQTLFEMPTYNCWPTAKTFNFVLNLLVCSKQFDIVHEVYMGAVKLGIEIDACCLNIMVKGLCGCGDFDAAFQVLDEFPKQGCRPSVRTYSTLMHGLCERGRVEEAFGLFGRMQREGIEPDSITFNILILGLRKQGRVVEGIELWRKMSLKGCGPNAGTYQEVLYCLLDSKKFLEAKDFMGEMISKGITPSFDSFKFTIHGLCKQRLVEDVDCVLEQMVRHGFVPKKGMWNEMVQCMLAAHGIPNCFSCVTYSTWFLEGDAIHLTKKIG